VIIAGGELDIAAGAGEGIGNDAAVDHKETFVIIVTLGSRSAHRIEKYAIGEINGVTESVS